jgi:predicted transcriptional regulator/transcriptional regulator with XRE-family HTH domain
MSEAETSAEVSQRILGHRVRAARRRAGLTLAQLGAAVGRPTSYLSRLENGHVEPRTSLLAEVARAVGVATAELLDPTPPTPRVRRELELEALLASPSYRQLGLPALQPSKVPDAVLDHLLVLGRQVTASADTASGPGRARAANAALRDEMRARDNYFAEIEELAGRSLEAAGYPGSGPVSERVMTDLASHFGFRVERVQGMPRSVRSIAEQRNRVIYVPQRNDLRTRAARSVVLQTLGHFALDHTPTDDFESYIRQRIESNYFAAAVLAPEAPAIALLRSAAARDDISVEDLKEVFYISYEMAGHRLTNLVTKHLDIPVHFVRTDPEGTILKAYENDGLPFPSDVEGGIEGQRVPRQWPERQAWESSDSFSLHYQHTAIDGRDYWSVTYLDTESPAVAITVGTTDEHAGRFRGSETLRRVTARASSADPALLARWEGAAWPSASERSFVLAALPPAERPFSPYPGVDLLDIYRFLDRRERQT